MKGFFGLTKRNLLLFFKDKQSIFFSLLTSIIVFVLYLLFLKSTFVNAIDGGLAEVPFLKTVISDAEVDMFANMILLTGILGSAMITVPFNCLSFFVGDRERKVDYDILATPLKRWQIILAYYTSASLSSMIMNGAMLSVGLLVLSSLGDLYMGVTDILLAYAIVALGSVSATAFFMIVVLMFKSTSASGAFFGILSAAAGFAIGAYIPISQFSDGVQTVCNLLPASQITILLRNGLMNGVLNHMNESIGGVDEGMFVEEMKSTFSFKAHIFSTDLGVKEMFIYVAIALVVCVAAQMVLFSKTYRKK